MFLHVGADYMVNKKDVIGIFDLDNTTISNSTKQFLAVANEDGLEVSATEDLPRSFVLVQHENSYKVVVSSISSVTLIRRYKTACSVINKEVKKTNRRKE